MAGPCSSWPLGGCPHTPHLQRPTPPHRLIPLGLRNWTNLVLSVGLSVPWTPGLRNGLDRRPGPGVSSGTCWEAPPGAGRSLQTGWAQTLPTQTWGEVGARVGQGRAGQGVQRKGGEGWWWGEGTGEGSRISAQG